MSNLEQLQNIWKYKKRRRVMSKVGGLLALIGLILMLSVSGEGDLWFSTIIIVGSIGCGLFCLGIFITKFINKLNEERPLVYKPVDKGDDL